MERRVLLAFSLSLVVMLLFSRWMTPPPQSDVATPAATTSTTATTSRPDAAPAVAPSPAPTPTAALVADTTEREFVVETEQVRAVFTNRGARLRHWILKAHRQADGATVDLVPSNVGDAPLPFTLAVDDAAVTARLNGELFRVEENAPERIDATASPAVLSFLYEGADGLRVRKRFGFQPAGYVVTLTAEVVRNGQTLNPAILWGPGLGDEIARTGGSGSFFTGSYSYPPEGFIHEAGAVERFAGAAAATAGTKRGPFPFAGVDDHYFVSGIIHAPGSPTVTFAHLPIPSPTGDGSVRQFVSYRVALEAPPTEQKFFVGPKQFEALRAIDPAFTKVINFGMFDILAVPLLTGLQWVHGYVGNYGWAIIILTILINLAIWPLRHKSVVSMRRMQELQPKLKVIQDRYAHLPMTDPGRAKMNEEVMALYREKGVNPVSGCLPMLLTLPVLFAFYSLLSQAIEIRGAPFMGWITDLSVRDPWYITPLLMGGTMFWQQKLQPGTGDPVQQKVLMFMPVMFTVMFLGAPSGLVIYWFVSNVWAIGQQYFTNWMIGPAKVTAGGKR